MDYDDQQLEILTSRAVLKKGPGHIDVACPMR